MFLAKNKNPLGDLAADKRKNLELKQLGLMKAIYFGRVLAQNKLSPTAKLVLQGLAYHYNPKKSYMFPSQRFLSEQLGMSVRSIERAVKELKNEGLIDYETKKVNFYFFTAKFWQIIEDYFNIESADMTESRPNSSLQKDNIGQNVGGKNSSIGQNVGSRSDKLADHDGQIVGQTNKEQVIRTKENLIKENEEYKKERIKRADNRYRPPEGVKYLPFEPVERVWDENNPKTHLKTARAFVKGLLKFRENFAIKKKIDEIVEIWGEAAIFAEEGEVDNGK